MEGDGKAFFIQDQRGRQRMLKDTTLPTWLKNVYVVRSIFSFHLLPQ
jgi:hypothetical protein